MRVVIVALIALASCSKHVEPEAKAKPPRPTSTIGSDGLRHVPIDVNALGYDPSRITGKPDEKLVLVFTRKNEDSCLAQVKMPDGRLVDLPMNTPVDVAVTVPPSGEVGFACGMDMIHGKIVAEP